MFDVLLASRHIRGPRPVVETVASAGFHVALILAFAGGTAVAADPERMERIDRFFDSITRFLAPPNRESALPSERTDFVGINPVGSVNGQTQGVAVKVEEHATAGDAVVPLKIAPAVELNQLAALQIAAREVGAFTIVDVDSAAERDPLSAAPAYPPDMLSQNVEGSASFRFVVDSTGLIDMSTVVLLKATHPSFAKAVRDVMPRMRFRPARMGVNTVRQLSEQPFTFQISKPPVPTAKPGQPPPDRR